MSFTLSGGAPTVEVSASAWISSQTDTTATIKVKSNSWMVYSGSWVLSSGVVANVYVGSSAWLGAKTIFGNGTETSGTSVHSVTHSYTVNKSTSSQSVYWESRFYSYIDGTNLGHKATKSGYVTVGAKTSYTVSYNANGGTGAPSNQTKWHGTSLTLSSTKPTRTGYSFQGWGISASDTTVDYAAGASYTSNAALSLYAIWKANTYTITYNANGGSGAPSSQTKTYGVDLTLSTTKPTRMNYNFLGWSTSSTAVVATYAPGATFTTNAATTLYAVWELAYTKPDIFLMQVDRCTSDGTLNDFGTYAAVDFNWSCCQLTGANEVSLIQVGYRVFGSTEDYSYTTVTASGTEGSFERVNDNAVVIGGGNLSVETQYEIQIYVADTLYPSDPSTRTLTLHQASFILDFKKGGTGIAIGKPAELDDTFEVAKRTIFSRGDEVDVGYTPSGYVTIGDPEGLHMSLDSNEIQAKSDGFTASSLLLQSGGGDTGVGGDLVVSGNVHMKNSKVLFSQNTSGVDRSMVQLNADGDYFFGYGGYVNSEGTSYFDGNSVNIRSKGAVAITSPTAGLTARYYGVNKVLWSGGYYMSSGQTATLSEAVSAQPNGIVVVWSAYTSSSATIHNYDWHYHFIPKHHVANHGGSGIGCFMSTVGFTYLCSKYIYVSDTTITGHANNSGSDTGSSVEYYNDHWVLRYVIGV